MGSKEVVGHFEAQCFQIFYHENRCATGVALAKGVYLPKVGTETGQVTNGFVNTFTLIAIISFLPDIVVKRLADGIGTGIIDGLTAKYPFLLGDVIVTYSPGKLINTFEQTTMDRC